MRLVQCGDGLIGGSAGDPAGGNSVSVCLHGNVTALSAGQPNALVRVGGMVQAVAMIDQTVRASAWTCAGMNGNGLPGFGWQVLASPMQPPSW